MPKLLRCSRIRCNLIGYRSSIDVLEGDNAINIVDTGYGVSQILPVLGQIWWAANADRAFPGPQAGPASRLLAIEQPELHLHPAHQAYLADALVDPPKMPGVSGARHSTYFIVETHSEALVNRLGDLVSMGRVKPGDIQILLFEPDDSDERKTNVRIAQFGEAGQLIDWPYGFFQPTV
jgi:predicted ATPase